MVRIEGFATSTSAETPRPSPLLRQSSLPPKDLTVIITIVKDQKDKTIFTSYPYMQPLHLSPQANLNLPKPKTYRTYPFCNFYLASHYFTFAFHKISPYGRLK